MKCYLQLLDLNQWSATCNHTAQLTGYDHSTPTCYCNDVEETSTIHTTKLDFHYASTRNHIQRQPIQQLYQYQDTQSNYRQYIIVECDLTVKTSTTSAYWNERRLLCQQYHLPRTQTTCLIRRLGRRRTVTSF